MPVTALKTTVFIGGGASATHDKLLANSLWHVDNPPLGPVLPGSTSNGGLRRRSLAGGGFVLVLQRQLQSVWIIPPVHRIEDALPCRPKGTRCTPPRLIAAVHRLPRTEVCRYLAPGGTRPYHPEHARQDRAMVVRRSADPHRLRREERRDARPSLVR